MNKIILPALVYGAMTVCLASCDIKSNARDSSLPLTAITSYSFSNPSAIGNINEGEKTIAIKVPYQTEVTGLIAVFTAPGTDVTVGGVAQESGITANDFTNPVIYSVTAADGSSTDYTVTVTVRALPDAEWVQRYGTNPSDADWEQPTAMVVDEAGNVYVAGGGNDATSAQSYGYITIKYDTDGNQLWVNRYATWDWPRSLAVDASGNVYVTGQWATVKYDSKGVLVWSKNYGYDDIRGLSLKIDVSGNAYVTGWKMNVENRDEGVIVKYDADGNQIWARTYFETGRYLSFTSVQIDTWDNVYAAGLSDAADGSDYAYILVKYEADGEVLWTRRIEGAPAIATSEKISLAVDGRGDVYIGGGIVEPGLDVLSSDFGLFKYDKDGTQLWRSVYNGPGNGFDYTSGIVLDSQDNIVVVGTSSGLAADADYATIKYDTNGNQQWIRRFDGGWDAATAITIDQMDNVYVTGGAGGPLGFETIKYDIHGKQCWVAYYGGPAEASGWGTAIALDLSGNVYVTGYSDGGSTYYDFTTIKYIQ